MAKWIGYAVSVNCGEPLGCYQGTIIEADGGTITLTKAFRNGFPYPKSQVTLNASDIKELKIIETRPETTGQTHSTVAVTKSSKKCQKATVCENLQANPSHPSSSDNQLSSNVGNGKATGRPSGSGPARSKPIDIQGNKNKNNNNNNNHHSGGSYGGGGGSTPRARGAGGGGGGGGAGLGRGTEAARRRNEACFGSNAFDAALAPDFDFEKNLALFDKQALWDQMRNSHKPDVVRGAEGGGKYRHDENILGSGGAEGRGVSVPPEWRRGAWLTDAGAALCGAAAELRVRLWRAVERHDTLHDALLLLAQAASCVALRLVGGDRRLDARNSHQQPTVLTITGHHYVGASGACVTRLLHAHGVRADTLPLPPPPAQYRLGIGDGPESSSAYWEHPQTARNLALCAELSPPVTLSQLGGRPRPDLGVLAARPGDPGYEAVCRWLLETRTPVLWLEPGPYVASTHCGLQGRASLWALVPGDSAHCAALGRVQLCSVAPPPAVFRAHCVHYSSPFGANTIIHLHAEGDHQHQHYD